MYKIKELSQDRLFSLSDKMRTPTVLFYTRYFLFFRPYGLKFAGKLSYVFLFALVSNAQIDISAFFSQRLQNVYLITHTEKYETRENFIVFPPTVRTQIRRARAVVLN